MAVTFTGNTTPAPNAQVGITSDGTLTIDGGSDLAASTIRAGVNAGVTGVVNVTGSGSSLALNAVSVPQITLGYSGHGSLNVLSGANVLVDGGFYYASGGSLVAG